MRVTNASFNVKNSNNVNKDQKSNNQINFGSIATKGVFSIEEVKGILTPIAEFTTNKIAGEEMHAIIKKTSGKIGDEVSMQLFPRAKRGFFSSNPSITLPINIENLAENLDKLHKLISKKCAATILNLELIGKRLGQEVPTPEQDAKTAIDAVYGEINFAQGLLERGKTKLSQSSHQDLLPRVKNARAMLEEKGLSSKESDKKITRFISIILNNKEQHPEIHLDGILNNLTPSNVDTALKIAEMSEGAGRNGNRLPLRNIAGILQATADDNVKASAVTELVEGLINNHFIDNEAKDVEKQLNAVHNILESPDRIKNIVSAVNNTNKDLFIPLVKRHILQFYRDAINYDYDLINTLNVITPETKSFIQKAMELKTVEGNFSYSGSDYLRLARSVNNNPELKLEDMDKLPRVPYSSGFFANCDLEHMLRNRGVEVKW